MNRREFSALLPMLLAAPALAPTAEGQAPAPQAAALPKLVSGLYPPAPATVPPTAPRISQHYILGLLPDNIRVEAHVTHLAPGAPPEPVGHHKHTEIWFVREGEASLMTAGVTRILKAGDMGVCIAGDDHTITNASKTEPASYFVVTVGPPE
jgi:mannose-6-phosphate isomerase-like protein (cupin superfamily)